MKLLNLKKNRIAKKGSFFVLGSKQSYSYDDLYQLTEANGQYIDRTLQALPKTYTYKQQYRYDNIGNMTRKISERYAKPNNSNPPLMNYDYSYTYSAEKPHQATKIGQWDYAYDFNGNLIKKDTESSNSGSSDGNFMENDTVNGVIDNNIMENDGDVDNSGVIDGNITDDTDLSETDSATNYLWDEENRLTRVENNKGKTYFLYNSDGDRTVKRSDRGEVLYISEFMQLSNDNLFTKHITVNGTRFASKLGNKGYGSIDTGYEQINTYYYHSDHISSTSFVTNYKGEEYEHFEYAPYGEIFVHEGDALDKLNWSFSAKELDEETGLFWFSPGRYLDATTSRWISVDPALLTGVYLPTGDPGQNGDLPGQGGVFNPINLSSYHYAGNNPLKYIDPTGESLILPNPYSPFDRLYISMSNSVHTVLDVVGVLPGVGEVADALNALLYLYQGQYGDAALSAMALIPIVGDLASKGGKTGKFFAKYGDEIIDFLKKYSGDAVEGLKEFVKSKLWNKSDEVIEILNKIGCFTAGSPILTEEGLKAIEKVEAGDFVYSKNIETGKVELKQVIRAYIREVNEIYYITINGKTIETTSEHPFWIIGKGWVEAKNIKSGDEVKTSDGVILKVDTIDIKLFIVPVKVYNIEVEGNHNYFVGDDSFLVHNNDACNEALNKTRKLWTINRFNKVMKHSKFGKILRDTKTGLWWAKDTAGHGGSAWKVFKENGKGLEWIADADEYGQFIAGKHKGNTGKFIPWKELKGVK